jgi:hypothetical protein
MITVVVVVKVKNWILRGRMINLNLFREIMMGICAYYSELNFN